VENPTVTTESSTDKARKPEGKKSKRTLWIIGGVIALVVVVVGVLLVVSRSSASPTPAGQAFGRFGNGSGQRPNFQMVPAPELPTANPDVTGRVTQLSASGLLVSEGGFGFRGNGGSQGQANGFTPPTPGPAVEVDVTSATTYYEDVTSFNFNGQQPPSGTIQQQVQPGSLTAITANSRVTVWGDKNGDKITAKVIVYSQPRQQPNGSSG
jgi:hypothetical protein